MPPCSQYSWQESVPAGTRTYARRTIIVSDKATDILASEIILNEPSAIENTSCIHADEFHRRVMGDADGQEHVELHKQLGFIVCRW